MKAAEMVKNMVAGKLYIYGSALSEEVRQGKAKDSGQPYTIHTLSVVCGNSTVEVSLPVEDGKQPVKKDLPRFAPVLIEVEAYPAPQVRDGKLYPGLRCRALALSTLEA